MKVRCVFGLHDWTFYVSQFVYGVTEASKQCDQCGKRVEIDE